MAQRLYFWGAQAASLQHSAASPNAFLREARGSKASFPRTKRFAASCRELQAGSLRSPDEQLRESSLFLHNEHERPDQCRGKQNADALQRPYITGH